ncbi:MAG: hypothetical protein JOZ36_06965 [Acidobacteria bacterium]|nr:hypothetical protein [Acidobacteriota bacterium]
MESPILPRAEPASLDQVRFRRGCRAVARLWIAALTALSALSVSPAFAAEIEGQVLGGGAPIARSTVTLWSAGSAAPAQLGQAQSGNDGRFTVGFQSRPEETLYLVAKGGEPTARKGGDNPAIALMAVLGRNPPTHVTLNEFTTIASVWTHNQFIKGTAINANGNPLGLRIAAGNVPNFVDLRTGGWGAAIQGSLNSNQTQTMANFATIADALSGCITRVTPDACASLFMAATPPAGGAPTDTLAAAEAVAKYPWYQPARIFALLDKFYPIPHGKTLRPVPRMPYLSFAPSAWVLPLKFGGGGLNAPGKIMFDADGNAWTGVNFIVGSQASDDLWDGNLAEFAPNGKALSPETTGFQGGGIEGPGFAMAGFSSAAWPKFGPPYTL